MCSSSSRRSKIPLARRCGYDVNCGMFSPRSMASSSTARSPVVGPPFEERWLSGRFAKAAFLPTPEEIEAADLFLGKAAPDLAAARLLAGDDEQDDDVVGFHAQQAVEKSLKAVVAVRSLELPRSHDLGPLI